jgi:hypothetical protein
VPSGGHLSMDGSPSAADGAKIMSNSIGVSPPSPCWRRRRWVHSTEITTSSRSICRVCERFFVEGDLLQQRDKRFPRDVVTAGSDPTHRRDGALVAQQRDGHPDRNCDCLPEYRTLPQPFRRGTATIRFYRRPLTTHGKSFPSFVKCFDLRVTTADPRAAMD